MVTYLMIKQYTYETIPIRTILFAPNAAELFKHYASESKSDLLPPIVVDNTRYLALEQAGALHCIGVFDKEATLVGFTISLLHTLPHYSKPAFTMESFFVLEEHRSKGTGKTLMDATTELAKEHECCVMFMSAPLDSRLNLVAKSFGYTATHTDYTKDLT